jgi:hypothetical protein
MATCIDLKKRFGDRYQVTYEESYAAQHGKRAHKPGPWLMIIPCRNGHIYPQGGDLLAASTNHRSRVATRLIELPGVTVVQDGSDGVNVAFPIAAFEQVAAVMKPRKRRKLSAKERAERDARLKRFRFPRASHDAGDDQERDDTDGADPKVA